MAIIRRQYRNKKNKKLVIYYQAELFVKGVRVAVKNFSRKREAIIWHEQEKHKFTTGSKNLLIPFRNLIDKFWDDIQTRMVPSTLQSYESRLTYIYHSPLAHLKMSEIKGKQIVEWIKWLKKQPTSKKISRKSFSKDLDLLRNILNWYRNFINDDFNVPITKKHRQMCFFKNIPPRRPDYYIQPKDVQRWVGWLKENKKPVYWRLAVFMLSTGSRIGEACGLKWKEVDLKRGTAGIIRQVRWDYFAMRAEIADSTKTHASARLLILPNKLKTILKQMKKESTNELVFADGDHLLKYHHIQSAFNTGFMALGLPWRSTHILRHTYATIALMTTKNLSAVQASLGHTEQRTTQRYAKTVALLNSETGEKTFSALFKNSRLS